MAKKKTAKRSIPVDHEKLGKRIKELRIQQGYTSAETFAYEKGLNRAQYGKYEIGRNITWDNLLKVIRALDVSVSEFFAEGFD